MKIAIVTLIGEFNNGNRLQNYALQEALKRVVPDAKIETINLKTNCTTKQKIKSIIKSVLKIFKRKYRNPNLKAFKQFNQKYMQFTAKKYPKNMDFSKLVDDFDYFVTGSDQVWNSNCIRTNPDYYFLNFVPTEKKLSYAASLGSDDLSNKEKALIKYYLKPYDEISVREKNSVNLLQDLGFTNMHANLDPTFLLSKDE